MNTTVARLTEPPHFIINPHSGGGRTRKRLPAIAQALARRGLGADIVTTQRRGHAYELATAAIKDGHTRLVAGGGDGTLYEVANAILDAGDGGDVVLGTLPVGTARDVARCLGISRPAAALSAIAAGSERRIDAGRIELTGGDGEPLTRHFLLEASAGWVPEVSQSTHRHLKRLGETAPYILMAFVKMLGPMGRDFAVEIDGQHHDGRYNTISVHNMAYWGGDLLAAPDASPDDGVLDVIRWGDLGRRAVVSAIQGQRNGGTHLRMEGIDAHRATSIRISSARQSVVDLDGEAGGYLPATVSVVPGAIRFMAPEASPFG